jgi:inhibitor of KinA sporulation pathway (predicted exonuclease)
MLSNLKEYPYFLVVDLEATCSEDDSISREEMETIEIGAVVVDSNTLQKIDEFQSFVKPIINPRLSAYCTELTSITQLEVEEAPTFQEVLESLISWLHPINGQFAFCSWGEFDKIQIERDCYLHGLLNPLESLHFNLKPLFSSSQSRKKQYGMAKALRISGIKLTGTHHRGIDDARNLVKLLPFILGKKLITLN